VDRHSEHGNVLFLILIAVALFAALSYAVTSSNRAGSGSTERERLKLTINEMQNHVTAIRTASTRLIASGCAISEISFERSPFDGSDTDYVNPNSPANFSCHIFHPNGGSAVFYENDAFLTEYRSGPEAMPGIGANERTDVYVRFNSLFASDREKAFKICSLINDDLGLGLPEDDPLTVAFEPLLDGSWSNQLFQGVTSDTGPPPFASSLFHGKYEICGGHSGNNVSYYAVTIAR